MHIWTKEFCIKVIEDVRERGFDDVSKEMGYKTSNILRCSLRSNSQKFDLLDEYDKITRPQKNGCLWSEELLLQVLKDVKERGFDEVSKEMGYSDRGSLMTMLKKKASDFGHLAEYDNLISRVYHEWTEEFLLQVIEDVKVKGVKAMVKELGYSDRYAFMDSFRDASVKYGKLPEYEQFLIRKVGKWTEEFLLQVLEDVKERGFDEVSEELGYASPKSLKGALKQYAKKFGITADQFE